MAELKPCPDCGVCPTILRFPQGRGEAALYLVMCMHCKKEPRIVARSFSKERAIEKWNRRVNNE